MVMENSCKNHLLFIIVDCLLGRFAPTVFLVKLVNFIGFLGSSYLVLFTVLMCMILMFDCLGYRLTPVN